MKLRASVSLALALVIAAALVEGTAGWKLVTFGAPAQIPRHISVAPAGWVPVAYGDAQVSVPASFSVIYPDQYQCDSLPVFGTIFLGALGTPDACLTSADTTTSETVVYLRSELFPSEWLTGTQPIVRNGLRLYHASLYGVPGYYAPSLGVVVAAAGPLAQQVLGTLEASPRVLALAHGPAPKAPVSWHSVTFAGLRFLAPAFWRVDRTQTTPGLGYICSTPGVAFWQTAVMLSTDARRMIVPACPLERPFPQQPMNSVQVDSGLSTEPMITLAVSKHCLILQGLTACPATSPAYSILVLRVMAPGRSKPVYVSIGLAGNGMTARTILYSLKPA